MIQAGVEGVFSHICGTTITKEPQFAAAILRNCAVKLPNWRKFFARQQNQRFIWRRFSGFIVKLTLAGSALVCLETRRNDVEMSSKTPEETNDGALIGEAMRLVRKMRRMSVAEVAKAMGMSARSYDYLESGQGRISNDRITRFAEATNSDPHALAAVVQLGSPEFAVRCADNKLMTIVMIHMGELNDELGNDIGYLELGVILGAMKKVNKDLTGWVRTRDTYAENWLQERQPQSRKSASVPVNVRKPRLAKG
ncbi:helix-turn-helix domain-containing protein [Sphingobium sp. 15-1]|uniref:helix-turn-helix domain-containing protein n=1 Tax=Sphingobium sp. 15-1 TaxID=2729616 RepID=UPI00159C55E6|nr:helix-turn-helix transcriptional regulator [Sphingobium sp. 15-1]